MKHTLKELTASPAQRKVRETVIKSSYACSSLWIAGIHGSGQAVSKAKTKCGNQLVLLLTVRYQERTRVILVTEVELTSGTTIRVDN